MLSFPNWLDQRTNNSTLGQVSMLSSQIRLGSHFIRISLFPTLVYHINRAGCQMLEESRVSQKNLNLERSCDLKWNFLACRQFKLDKVLSILCSLGNDLLVFAP